MVVDVHPIGSTRFQEKSVSDRHLLPLFGGSMTEKIQSRICYECNISIFYGKCQEVLKKYHEIEVCGHKKSRSIKDRLFSITDIRKRTSPEGPALIHLILMSVSDSVFLSQRILCLFSLIPLLDRPQIPNHTGINLGFPAACRANGFLT